MYLLWRYGAESHISSRNKKKVQFQYMLYKAILYICKLRFASLGHIEHFIVCQHKCRNSIQHHQCACPRIGSWFRFPVLLLLFQSNPDIDSCMKLTVVLSTPSDTKSKADLSTSSLHPIYTLVVYYDQLQ